MSETITNETTGESAVIRMEEIIESWMNPRHDVDGLLGTMCTEHRRVTLGDEKRDMHSIPEEILDGDVTPVEYFQREHGARVVLVLDLYEHSGMTIRARQIGERAVYPFNDRWDAGVVGFIFDTPEALKEAGCEDWTDEQIREDLIAEVKVYDSYLRGEVYFVDHGDDTVGGCIGYEHAVDTAKDLLGIAA